MSRDRKIIESLLERAGVRVDGPDPWDMSVRDSRLFTRVLNDKSLLQSRTSRLKMSTILVPIMRKHIERGTGTFKPCGTNFRIGLMSQLDECSSIIFCHVLQLSGPGTLISGNWS